MASWGDVDNDVLLDLYVGRYLEPRKHIPTTFYARNGEPNQLYRNNGDGSFTNITEKAGVGEIGLCLGTVFGDYDNDGDKDAFISRTFKPNQIWRNNGDGTFTDVTKQAGIGEDCCTTVASWGDIDNDGWLDLYVGRYLEPRKYIPTTFYARNGEPNQLYRNNGDGTFTNLGIGDLKIGSHVKDSRYAADLIRQHRGETVKFGGIRALQGVQILAFRELAADANRWGIL